MGPTYTLSMQINSEKSLSISKIKNFLTFHARKTFFQAHIQSRIDYAWTLRDSSSESVLNPLNLYTEEQSR